MKKERQWEIEKERISMQSGGQRSAQNVSGSTDLNGIKAMLTSMQDCDIVSFFTSFEQILELRETDKGLWPKLLPSQLSAKAVRAYSRVSLDETKCYQKSETYYIAE